MTLTTLLLFIIGLLAASVLWNISELGSQKYLRLEPSCATCGTALPATIWLPLYGFFTSRRCRSCGTRQTNTRFGWEIGVALYFVLLGWRWNDDTRSLIFSIVSSIPVLLILIVDVRGHVLYFNSIVLALIVAAVLGFLDGPSGMGSAMVGLIAGVGIAVAYFALSRWVFRSMDYRVSNIGTGDIYIAAAVGAIVRGNGVVPAIAFAIIFTLLGSVLLPVVSKSARRRATVYGTYLCLGALITLLR